MPKPKAKARPDGVEAEILRLLGERGRDVRNGDSEGPGPPVELAAVAPLPAGEGGARRKQEGAARHAAREAAARRSSRRLTPDRACESSFGWEKIRAWRRLRLRLRRPPWRPHDSPCGSRWPKKVLLVNREGLLVDPDEGAVIRPLLYGYDIPIPA